MTPLPETRACATRAQVNHGLAWDHNWAFDLARGRYLAWIGHDDIMDNQYMLDVLKPWKRMLGWCWPTRATTTLTTKEVIKPLDLENPGSSERPSERFNNILCDGMCDPIYGLMKTEVLKQTRLHGGFADSDRVLLAEMGLRGRFSLVPEHLFSRRIHAEQNHRKYKDLRERTVSMDPAKAGKLFFPVLLEDMALFSAIRRANLPLGERLRCHKAFLRWIWKHCEVSPR